MAQHTLSEQPVPRKVSQVAATHQLGTPKAVYTTGLSPLMIFLVVLCLLFALLFFVAWYSTSFVHLPNFSESTPSNAPLFFLGFLLMLGLALMVPLRIFFKRTLRVYVYANGLVRAEKNTTEVIRWDQVISVTRVKGRGFSSYNVLRYDGKKMVFSHLLLKVDDLGETIALEVSRYLFPKKHAAQSARDLESSLARLSVAIDWQGSDPQTALLGGMAKASLALAWEECKAGKFDEAIKNATLLIDNANLQQNPSFVSVLCAAHYVRGLAYQKQGDAIQARLNFQSALQLSPDYLLAKRAMRGIDQHS